MDVKVSVIIPVYNCEKYIEECIESLINQSLRECEFIFINDGSKDKSEEIIKKYANKDNRIKLINQKNSGVSVARNRGIKKAVGEYIGFVDADDYVESNYLKKMYMAANENKCSIVISDWIIKNNSLETVSKLSIEHNKVFDKNHIEKLIYPKLIKSSEFNAIWNKLYLRKIINDNSIKFYENISLGEDARFNIKAFTYAESILYIDYPGYYYRQTNNGITQTSIKSESLNNTIREFKEDIIYFRLWNINKEDLDKLRVEKFINSIIALIYIYFNSINDINIKSRFKYVSTIVNNKEVKNIFHKYRKYIYLNRNRYEKVIIFCIEKNIYVGMYLATLYSRLRSR